jgi:hypothetical protein
MPLTEEELKKIVTELDEEDDYSFFTLTQIEKIEEVLKKHLENQKNSKCWGC